MLVKIPIIGGVVVGSGGTCILVHCFQLFLGVNGVSHCRHAFFPVPVKILRQDDRKILLQGIQRFPIGGEVIRTRANNHKIALFGLFGAHLHRADNDHDQKKQPDNRFPLMMIPEVVQKSPDFAMLSLRHHNVAAGGFALFSFGVLVHGLLLSGMPRHGRGDQSLVTESTL